MASKVSCNVKFGRFKWRRKGYREVMNGGACQSLLLRTGRGMANDLNSELGGGYEVHRKAGILANGCVVSASPAAMDGELRHNRLKRKADGS